jgi:uncharacterized oxidoreductase
MKLAGNTIFITGGTSGIGRALAEQFHARGNRVIIAGRRKALLDEITAQHPGMRGLELDVTDPAAVARLDLPDVNVLINNAGISRAEDLTTDTLAIAREIIDANIVSVLHVTRALLPTLLQHSSTILTTSSNLAFMPRANYPTYCASKAFLHSWLQSLRWQLRATSVEVIELLPPFVQTELTGPAQATNPHAMPLAAYIAEVMQLLETSATEICVEFGSELRASVCNGTYDELFAKRNG